MRRQDSEEGDSGPKIADAREKLAIYSSPGPSSRCVASRRVQASSPSGYSSICPSASSVRVFARRFATSRPIRSSRVCRLPTLGLVIVGHARPRRSRILPVPVGRRHAGKQIRTTSWSCSRDRSVEKNRSILIEVDRRSAASGVATPRCPIRASATPRRAAPRRPAPRRTALLGIYAGSENGRIRNRYGLRSGGYHGRFGAARDVFVGAPMRHQERRIYFR